MKKCQELFRRALKLLDSKKRQITSSLMCLVVLLTIVPQGTLTVLAVSSESDLSTEFQEDSSSDYSSSSTADHVHQGEISFSKLDGNFTGGELAPGDYYLDSDIPITKTIIISNGTVNLCLNGHTISQEGSGTVIEIKEGASLNLQDCSLNNAGCITSNKTGWGILNSGTFTMNSGTISNCQHKVDVAGGAICNNGTFTMNGGVISGNGKGATCGGGVYSTKTFYMNGGIICNNIGFYGGGIFISSGTFTMNGGSISNNSGSKGGGILVSFAKFTLTNGTISGNTANETGGGIYISGHTLILNGGNITANTAGENGGGVYTDRPFSDFIITVGGSPTITDNMVTTGTDSTEVIEENFCIGKLVNAATLNIFRISDDFSGKIGVSTTLVPTLDSPTVISVSVNKDYSNYFFSDKDGYEIFNSGSGNNQVLKLIVSHEHEWQESWSSDNSPHWHECYLCHEKKDEAAHTLEEDDADCSTAVHCLVCNRETTAGQSHDFTGKCLKDEEGHWYQYSHNGCTVTSTKEAHVWIESGRLIEPTYFSNGQGVETCEICNKVRTVWIPPLVDKIPPTGNIIINGNSIKKALNTITFGLFFKEIQRVTVMAEDDETGVKSIQYYKSSEVMDEDAIKNISFWTNYTGAFSLNPNDKYVIYVKITDNQNNVTYIGSDGITIDVTDPVISGIEDRKTYCIDAEFTVTDDNLDTIKVNEETNLIDGSLTLYPSDKVQTITARDKSGNEKSVSIRVSDQHQWDEGLVTLEPTASAKGVKVYTCIHCGKRKTEELPILAPSIINGHNSTWRPEEGGILTFRSNATFKDFINVLLNSQILESKYYEVREGSIIVTLKADYLSSLPAGTYTLGIQSVKGIASTKFTIAPKNNVEEPSKPDDNKAPQTEDEKTSQVEEEKNPKDEKEKAPQSGEEKNPQDKEEKAPKSEDSNLPQGEDKNSSQTDDSKSSQSNKKNSPKTGDDRNISFWFALLLLSGATFIASIKKRKENKSLV